MLGIQFEHTTSQLNHCWLTIIKTKDANSEVKKDVEILCKFPLIGSRNLSINLQVFYPSLIDRIDGNIREC
jgi:hypothetical protein